jgi:hypothetical protein
MAKVEFDNLMSVGIDIGKDKIHIIGFDHDGQRVLRKADQTPCIGHDVRKVAALYCRNGGVSECPLCQSHAAQHGF